MRDQQLSQPFLHAKTQFLNLMRAAYEKGKALCKLFMLSCISKYFHHAHFSITNFQTQTYLFLAVHTLFIREISSQLENWAVAAEATRVRLCIANMSSGSGRLGTCDACPASCTNLCCVTCARCSLLLMLRGHFSCGTSITKRLQNL